MKKGKRMAVYITIALCLVLIIGGITLYIRYSRDIKAAYIRLDQHDRNLIDTPCGKIEYAVIGEGKPVLFIHGNAGGFDQGINLATSVLGKGFMAIAPSRFGYLDTQLPEGASPSDQADAYVCLLDSLNVGKAAVVAYSAGGPSAVQLVLRYPERVSALVLVSTAIANRPLKLPPKPVIQAIFGSDFLAWLITEPLSSVMKSMFVPRSYQLSQEDRAEIAQAMREILPSRPRVKGMVFDMFVTNTDPYRNNEEYALEKVSVPVLIINARDDPAANYEDARAMSDRIPDSRFVSVEEGGHLLLGTGNLVKTEILNFLR